MANGNRGIGSYLPFPSFGGEKSPGILPVQLQPSPMKFPTPRAIQRRALEPTTKEKLAPFAPLLVEGLGSLLVEGLGSLFAKDPEVMDDAAYLKSIDADVADPTKMEQARLDAYKLFGTEAEPEGWGTKLAHMATGLSMGRGAGDYADTYFALRKGKAAKEAAEATARAAFIKSRTDASLQKDNFINLEALKTGNWQIGVGRFDPDDGAFVIQDPKDKTNWVNIEKLEGKWIAMENLPNDFDPMSFMKENYKELAGIDTEIIDKDLKAINFLNITANLIKELEGPDAPTTVVASLARMADNVAVNFDQAMDLFGFDGFGTTQNPGGSRGREGSGELSKQLLDAMNSGNEAQIREAMAAFETGTGTNFRQTLGDLAYKNVVTTSLMLQLAYMAAAANGQTGRTLSDKDLAYHLQMVGFGASSNPEILKKNIIRFANRILSDTDSNARARLSPNRVGAGRFGTLDEISKDPQLQGFLNTVWEPKDKDYKDVKNYRFKPFSERQGTDPVVIDWFAKGYGAELDVAEDLRKLLSDPDVDIAEIEKLLE